MSENNHLEGKRVLVVDDEPDVLESLEDLLTVCNVSTAGNYEDACKLIDGGMFDLAVLDIMGVSGYELLERCVDRGVTAVMLTAQALAPEDVARSYKEGAAYYIPKEEMANIESFLNDILDAQARGRNTWGNWYDRLTSFAERTFHRNFDPDSEDFLQQLIKY